MPKHLCSHRDMCYKISVRFLVTYWPTKAWWAWNIYAFPRHIIEMPSEQVLTELWRSSGRGGAAEPAVREDVLSPPSEAFSTLFTKKTSLFWGWRWYVEALLLLAVYIPSGGSQNRGHAHQRQLLVRRAQSCCLSQSWSTWACLTAGAANTRQRSQTAGLLQQTHFTVLEGLQLKCLLFEHLIWWHRFWRLWNHCDCA